MDLDELDKALTGQEITGTDAAVALGLLLVGLLLYVVVGRLLRRAASRMPDDVVPGEAVEIGVRLAQLLVLGVFVAWALTVLGANFGWLTLLIVALLAIDAIAAKPFMGLPRLRRHLTWLAGLEFPRCARHGLVRAVPCGTNLEVLARHDAMPAHGPQTSPPDSGH